jgi:hypothetical protein
MPTQAQQHTARPLAFQARFRGALEASWFANLLNVSLSSTGTGSTAETILVAEAPDEATLMGVLNLLYELGCPLNSLECPDWGAVVDRSDRSETPAA